MKISYGDCRTNNPKGYFCRRNITNKYFISYFETPFLYEYEGRLVKGNAGEFMIIPPGQPVYHGAVNGEEFYINTWVYIQGEGMEELLKKYPLPLNVAFSAGPGNILDRFVEKAKKESFVKSVGYEDKIYHLTAQLIIDLFRLYHRKPGMAGRLERVREEILQAPEKSWTLKEMAAFCGYSVSRFSALYKERFGISPKQDILNARIDLAAQMLKYTDFSITDIAADCGFQSIYYFSKYFKEAKGISPKEYIKKHKT